MADPGAELVFESPHGPSQDMARVVAGVQDGLREQVANVGDGGVGE